MKTQIIYSMQDHAPYCLIPPNHAAIDMRQDLPIIPA